jgi:hypothetical protein
MDTLPNRAICHRIVFLIALLVWLHIVRLFVHVWPFGYVYRAQYGSGERTLRFFRLLTMLR